MSHSAAKTHDTDPISPGPALASTGTPTLDDERIFEVLLTSVNEYSGRQYTAADIDRSRPVFDYGVDSLNMMQILTELEDELGLEIDLSELSESQLESVDALIEYLGSRRKTAPESV